MGATPEFRTGWFVESIASQTLVVYVIRTRRVPFVKGRPSRPMLLVADRGSSRRRPGVHSACPRAGVRSPAATLLLFGIVVVYLLLVELAKFRFYRCPRAGVQGLTSTPAERVERHLRRRASRFIRHPAQWVAKRGLTETRVSCISVRRTSTSDRRRTVVDAAVIGTRCAPFTVLTGLTGASAC